MNIRDNSVPIPVIQGNKRIKGAHQHTDGGRPVTSRRKKRQPVHDSGGGVPAPPTKPPHGSQRAVDDFQWEVDVDGHRIFSADELVSAKELGNSNSCYIGAYRGINKTIRNTRPYKLADSPELFQTFAATTVNRGGILAFADQYGLLGFVEPHLGIESLTDKQGRHSNWELESVDDWVVEILRMRWTIETWQMIRTRDQTGLRSRIRFDSRREVLLHTVPEPILEEFPLAWFRTCEWHIAARDKEETLLDRFQRDDSVLLPARAYVEQVINQHMRRQVSVEIRKDSDGVGLVLSAAPTSLLGALWLQFAINVTSKATLRHCDYCGFWMEIAKGGARSNKRYCSDSCRTRAFRTRRGNSR